ncbi:aminotransferase class I/II-fold pyridoxal phosphate-dependent enzyme [Neobacillus sp. SuZ13]|uniref:aminotransferase class I/II-fold pyridoxal phosphate-dependent enzyme n=1 Tax=Neobacillus sp. SuZ13 TaxID=3047875 RepID=UPI0024C0D229|nr:aminotransferase class I/II-fold pyridoxal phosphate-dependent enzyme [Neobacillus sp. SuZ13]WHY67157.1 aminotransferase class I/II-fold pyridoxal phosphate-dependent enzyme [Neobacillus sp. SuZ13]
MNNQSKIPLYDALIQHINKRPVSFHVPGHKYGEVLQPEAHRYFQKILKIDATELSGLDDLHSPEGAILEAESLLANLYHTRKSYFLVNGSTVGNLAMIMAACEEGAKVLVQRNCHKSILNGLSLAKADPIFVEPEFNHEWKIPSGIGLETVKESIKLYPDAKALILTYPNYYGLGYALQEIINEAHRHNIPVLVDEAHGPHLILGAPFPPSALQLGADIVVQSAHKILPAMTMGSYLHISSDLINRKKLEEYLAMFQSSSPSYPIMASLDLARNYLGEYTQEDVTFLLTGIRRFRDELANIPAIKVLEYPNDNGDPLKITIQSRCHLSGFELQRRLEESAIFTELADPNNLLFILPLLKDGQSFPFEETLLKIKKALAGLSVHTAHEIVETASQKISSLAIPFKEMENLEIKELPISIALGEVCAETIIPYPPGIPLLLKGERITIDKLSQLSRLIQTGARFQGGALLKDGCIKIFCTA